MKNKSTLAAVISTLFLVSFSASAEMGHQPTRVNFNKMIDANTAEKSELRENLNDRFHDKKELRAKTDEKKVIDFVDVEIGLGETPQVVDRRYDSVSAPQVDSF